MLTADAGGGVLRVSETTAGGDLTIGAVTVDGTAYSTTSATGTITIATANGTLTLDDTVTASGASGVLLTANGVSGDVAVNADVQTGSGNLALTAGRDITTDNTGHLISTVAGLGTLRLDAGNGIGTTTNRIDIDVPTVAARLTGGSATGDIWLNHIDGGQDTFTIGTASSLSGISTTNNRSILVVSQNDTLTVAASGGGQRFGQRGPAGPGYRVRRSHQRSDRQQRQRRGPDRRRPEHPDQHRDRDDR